MLLTLYGSFKKGIWQRNHNRHFLNLLQCSYTQPRFQAVMLVPIEASYFNNLQINKQSLLPQLMIKLENMRLVGMT